MSTHLLSISRTSEANAYEVVLEIDGRREGMRCRVVEHKGIRAVQPTSDLTWQLTFDPRLLAAAVIAFDEAKESGGESG